MTFVYVGLDRGDTTVAAAEHWLHELLEGTDQSGIVTCTHFVRVPTPHVAVSVALPAGAAVPPLPEPAEQFAEGARIARDEHASGTGGRAVTFPGRTAMVGVMTVAELLSAGAIERVAVLGSSAHPDPATEVDTLSYVRPQWMNGSLTLLTQPANGGRLAPFELADQKDCCSDH